MRNDFVTISIWCSHCLSWSLEDADFCHRCGRNLRLDQTEDLRRSTRDLLEEVKRLADESRTILDMIAGRT